MWFENTKRLDVMEADLTHLRCHKLKYRLTMDFVAVSGNRINFKEADHDQYLFGTKNIPEYQVFDEPFFPIEGDFGLVEHTKGTGKICTEFVHIVLMCISHLIQVSGVILEHGQEVGLRMM